MSKIAKLIWNNWIRPLTVYAIMWAGFRFWLDFDNMQSIVFAFSFGACYFGFKELNKKTEKVEDFIPYRVSIRFHNTRDFLFKYGFAKTEEDWERFRTEIQDTSLFRRGMNFTVLSMSKDGLPHLIWSDDYKTFLAGLPSFEDVLQGLVFPNSGSVRLPDSTWSARFYFGYRHGKGRGYKIALDVREEWWEQNKTEGIETDNDRLTGSVYLIFGVLPIEELGLIYEARHLDRKTELEKLGWAIKDRHDSEIRAFDTIEVQNEYFSVSQQFLETD